MPERRNFLLGIGIGGAFIYSLFRWYRSGRFWFNYDRHAHIKDKTPVASPSSGLVHSSNSCIGDKTPKRERRVHFTAAAPVEIQIVRMSIWKSVIYRWNIMKRRHIV